jgi:hypothetical protein
MQPIAQAMSQGGGEDASDVVMVEEVSPDEAARIEEEKRKAQELAIAGARRAVRHRGRVARGRGVLPGHRRREPRRASKLDLAEEADGAGRTNERESAKTTRSTVFPNITRPTLTRRRRGSPTCCCRRMTVLGAITPTPIPEAEERVEGQVHAGHAEGWPRRSTRRARTGAKKALAIATEAALQVIAEAKAKADKAQTRIEDWHVECQWHAQVRLVIEDAARVGVGVLKGPIPKQKQRVVWKNGGIGISREDQARLEVDRLLELLPGPGLRREHPQRQLHVGARQPHTKQLRDLVGQDGYIDDQIQACLTEGPTRAIASTSRRRTSSSPTRTRRTSTRFGTSTAPRSATT